MNPKLEEEPGSKIQQRERGGEGGEKMMWGGVWEDGNPMG